MNTDTQTKPRNALIAGSTGLVGSALLPLLLSAPHYQAVHLLARRALQAPSKKAQVHVVDFSHLPALPAVNDVFICLGTTIKVAGSQAAFRAVDFDAVVNTARAAKAAGATRLALVSAMGASAKSSVFYSRVKGEAEEALKALGYESLTIVRPSFLAGNRQALGQATRPGEHIALLVSQVLRPLIPLKYRAIKAEAVAAAMLNSLSLGKLGVTVLESDALQKFATH